MPSKISYLKGAQDCVKLLRVVNTPPAAIKSMIEKISNPPYTFPETDCLPDADRS